VVPRRMPSGHVRPVDDDPPGAPGQHVAHVVVAVAQPIVGGQSVQALERPPLEAPGQLRPGDRDLGSQELPPLERRPRAPDRAAPRRPSGYGPTCTTLECVDEDAKRRTTSSTTRMVSPMPTHPSTMPATAKPRPSSAPPPRSICALPEYPKTSARIGPITGSG